MRGDASREVVRHLRTLYHFGVTGTFSDEQLLERFLARRDETAEEAFAELVQRHGPMVLGVCLRVLGDAHEAEDAFQATFLVLARKAASVVRREKVASWLYGVAVRTAKEARVRAVRRRAREERVSMPIHVEPPEDGFPAELRAILDEELARLPSRHRGAVVLCELEGLSRPEAARRLGIPEGTLSSRLARAKSQLRDRLARRGVSLPAAALSAILLREAQAATLPLCLLESTVEAATLVAAGPTAAAAISASVASLSEGVLKTMFVAKLKGIVLAVGTMTAVVSGAVVLAQSGSRTGDRPKADGGFRRESLPPAEAVAARDDQDERAVLEKKLDRILDALERLSRTASRPGAHAAAEPLGPAPVPPLDGARPAADVADAVSLASADQPPPRSPDAPNPPQPIMPPPRPPDAPHPPQANQPPPRQLYAPNPLRADRFTPAPPPPPAGPNMPMPPGSAPMSLADRMQALEQQMQEVQQRLERLERHLNLLDARVGGAEVEQLPRPAPPLPPSAK